MSASTLAARAHRLSGLALALFLPLHFFVLARSLQGEAALEQAIAWTSLPAVKFAECGLVVLLALHLGLGLRVLALEFLPWQRRQKLLAGGAVAVALLAGAAFAWSVR
jgi:fumarate reductase subunit D